MIRLSLSTLKIVISRLQMLFILTSVYLFSSVTLAQEKYRGAASSNSCEMIFLSEPNLTLGSNTQVNTKNLLADLKLKFLLRNKPTTRDQLIDQIKKISPSYSKAISSLLMLHEWLANGNSVKLKLDNINLIHTIRKGLIDGASEIESLGLRGWEKTIWSKVEIFMNENPSFTHINGSIVPAYDPAQQSLTAYLKKQYDDSLSEVNKLLPPELRLPQIEYHYPDISATQIKELRATNREAFLSTMHSFSGFHDYRSYMEALEKAGPRVAELQKILDSDQIEVVFNSGARHVDILRNGPLSAYVTGRTNASGSFTSYMETRNRVEASRFGVSEEMYNTLDPLVHPVYGTLRYIKPENQDKTYNDITHFWYGQNSWIYRASDLKNQISLHLGDSYRDGMGGGPIDLRTTEPRESTLQYFIPWEFRHLIIPFLLHGEHSKPDVNIFNNSTTEWTEQESQIFDNGYFRKKGAGLYLEVQVTRGSKFPLPYKREFYIDPLRKEKPPMDEVRELWDKGIIVQVKGPSETKIWHKETEMPDVK